MEALPDTGMKLTKLGERRSFAAYPRCSRDLLTMARESAHLLEAHARRLGPLQKLPTFLRLQLAGRSLPSE